MAKTQMETNSPTHTGIEKESLCQLWTRCEVLSTLFPFHGKVTWHHLLGGQLDNKCEKFINTFGFNDTISKTVLRK